LPAEDWKNRSNQSSGKSVAPYISLNLFPTLNSLTDLNDDARSLSVKGSANCLLGRADVWSDDGRGSCGEELFVLSASLDRLVALIGIEVSL